MALYSKQLLSSDPVSVYHQNRVSNTQYPVVTDSIHTKAFVDTPTNDFEKHDMASFQYPSTNEINETPMASNYGRTKVQQSTYYVDPTALSTESLVSSSVTKRIRRRRTFKELTREIRCPVADCKRKYASRSSLSTHARLKHSQAAQAAQEEDAKKKKKMNRPPKLLKPKTVPIVNFPLPTTNSLLRQSAFGMNTGLMCMPRPRISVASQDSSPFDCTTPVPSSKFPSPSDNDMLFDNFLMCALEDTNELETMNLKYGTSNHVNHSPGTDASIHSYSSISPFTSSEDFKLLSNDTNIRRLNRMSPIEKPTRVDGTRNGIEEMDRLLHNIGKLLPTASCHISQMEPLVMY